MSTPTFVLARPVRMIFANRRSSSLTRSPYSVPGVIRLTVADGALFDRGRPRDGAIAEFGAAQFAASAPPWSLRAVPLTCTSIFGTVYEPSAVNRVTQPVFQLQYGLVGLGLVGTGGPGITCSGIAARIEQ